MPYAGTPTIVHIQNPSFRANATPIKISSLIQANLLRLHYTVVSTTHICKHKVNIVCLAQFSVLHDTRPLTRHKSTYYRHVTIRCTNWTHNHSASHKLHKTFSPPPPLTYMCGMILADHVSPSRPCILSPTTPSCCSLLHPHTTQ